MKGILDGCYWKPLDNPIWYCDRDRWLDEVYNKVIENKMSYKSEMQQPVCAK